MPPLNTARQLGWYWHRLRAMDAAEIRGRIAARARRFNEANAQRALDEFRLGQPSDASPLGCDGTAAPASVLESVARDATAVRRGEWNLFGWKVVQTSLPPVWHRDYLHDVDGPAGGAAAGINHRQLDDGADVRAVWEINRWAEMVRLAQNAWLNHCHSDALLAQEWLNDWCDQNPPGTGINWTSPLEGALRLMNFTWIDALIRKLNDPSLSAAQDVLAQRIVPSHAWWVWRQRSFGSSANNHLLGELAGLILAARRWPTLARIACSAERAWELLVSEARRQFHSDGGNREQALHYHHFAWEMLFQSARMMGGAGAELGPLLERAAQFFSDLVQPDAPWDFGDSDDAQITPATNSRRGALREWRAWFLREGDGEALDFWFGASPAAARRLLPATWKSYPESGQAVLEAGGWKARLDASPLGFGSMAAHGHLDALHLSLWCDGQALVVDPGTGAYYGDPQLRARLAGWEHHNGPVPVRGRLSPKRMGLFLWAAHHDMPRLECTDRQCSVRFACDGSFVQRTVAFEDDGWRILDEAPCREAHVVRWRLAPEWLVESRFSGVVTLVHRDHGQRIRLEVTAEKLEDFALDEGDLSPHFGSVERGVVMACAFRCRLESRWRRV